MKTACFTDLSKAVQLLQQGEVVAIPTETVYGLAADATDDLAIQKIFQAKGRPSDNPLIVHIGTFSQLEEIAKDIPAKAKLLMEHFWPGPLTLILPKTETVSDLVTSGLETVGVRMPSHPVAKELIERSGIPVAAPSANTSGKPSPTTSQHVFNDLAGKIAGILEGGKAEIGVESTVLDCTVTPPMLLRPGGVSLSAMEDLIGFIETDPALLSDESAPRSPGMKYRHYAPEAPLTLVDGSFEFIQALIDKERKNGHRVGFLSLRNRPYQADVIVKCGHEEDFSSVANELYHALRQLDEEELDVIFSEVIPEDGLGHAIMNRLRKASSNRIIIGHD